MRPVFRFLLGVFLALTVYLFCFLSPSFVFAEEVCVVINEVAWMGTSASSADEWLELYNCGLSVVNLEGWELSEISSEEEILIEPLSGTLAPEEYFLLERTDNNTIPDIPASQEPSGWGGAGLSNSGEHLVLKNNLGEVMDDVNCNLGNGWFAGDNGIKATMERVDPQRAGSDPDNWATNDGLLINGRDAEGDFIFGTPLSRNSTYLKSLPTPSLVPTTAPAATTAPVSKPTPSPVDHGSPVTSYHNITITEFLPCPRVGEREWVEIHNSNPFKVELVNWQIDDIEGGAAPYTLSAPLSIVMYGYIQIIIEGKSMFNNSGGDSVRLLDPNAAVVDSISYKLCTVDHSWARDGETYESLWRQTSAPTPGEANIFFDNAPASPQPEPSQPLVHITRSIGQQAGQSGAVPGQEDRSDQLPAVVYHPSFLPPHLGSSSGIGSVSGEARASTPGGQSSPSLKLSGRKYVIGGVGFFITAVGFLIFRHRSTAH